MKKRDKIIYWIATLWLALGMVSTALGQVFKIREGQGAADMISHLGYPDYLLAILGFWKIIGTMAVLMPRLPLMKEWAYAGFFFMMTGAICSHISVGDPLSTTLPALLLIALTVISWYFRPADRKINVS